MVDAGGISPELHEVAGKLTIVSTHYMDQRVQFLWLSLLGLIAGGYGTIVGAGGGFIIAPVLLFMYPTTAPETITTISLAVVFANALSGTLAYAHSKRIDYSNGIIFSLAAAPGAVLGAVTTTTLHRARFDLLFGALMICVAVFLSCGPPEPGRESALAAENKSKFNIPNLLKFNIPNLLLSAGVSTSLGFISSFFGVGGGFLYVPALVYLLRLSVHTATATSLFILLVTAFTGSVTHFAAGLFKHGMRPAIVLSFAAIIGAQIGARFSEKIETKWIIRGLTFALGLIGLRLVVTSVF